MSRAKSIPSFFGLILLAVSLSQNVYGQTQVHGPIRESKGQVQFRGVVVSIGATRKQIDKTLGKPRRARATGNWNYFGLDLQFDKNDRIDAIILSRPFGGKTESGFQIGTKVRSLARVNPKFANLADGWHNLPHMQIQVTKGRVATIQLGRKRTIVAPIIRQKTPKRERKPRPAPVQKRATPDQTKPIRRTAPRTGLTPNPQRKPVLPGANLNGSPLRPTAQSIKVWETSWQSNGRLKWMTTPLNSWPTDRGLLLVRVDFDGPIDRCEQLFCDYHLAPTNARDYIYQPDIVQSKRKAGTPLRWQWRIRGKGRAKVKILWFQDKKRLLRYQRDNPYRTNFAFKRKPQPWRDQVKLVWQETWRANGDNRLIRGPKENWPDDRGILLLRAFGGPGIGRVVYRAGLKNPIAISLEDHPLPVDILDRARRRNLFGSLSGDDRKRFHFGAEGQGQVKVMLYWLPDQRYVKTYCEENPWQSGNPWANRNPVNPQSWIFGGPTQWRHQSQYEAEWVTPYASISQASINVASRSTGAIVRRSSVRSSGSRGSEFDQGIWYSNRSRHAFTESRFTGLAQLKSVQIGTAGSDNEEARYIIVEGELASGRWQRLAVFHNENINWHRLSGKRRAISRPRISIPVNSQESFRAVRIVLAGDGPFRVGGVRVLGRFQGQRQFEDPPELITTARDVRLSARRPWTNTGGEVLAGRSILVDIDGSWSVAPRDQNSFGWSGPEGIADTLFRSFFSNTTARQNYCRGLPAPNLPVGCLIGRIGVNGRPFLVTPRHPLNIEVSGQLFLGINDQNCEDNRGELVCTVIGAFFANAPAQQRPDSNLVRVRCHGVIRSTSLRRPIGGVDIFLQSEAWPRTIHGGGRTDAQGRYDFSILVPRNLGMLINAPEFKVETTPRIYQSDGEFQYDITLR